MTTWSVRMPGLKKPFRVAFRCSRPPGRTAGCLFWSRTGRLVLLRICHPGQRGTRVRQKGGHHFCVKPQPFSTLEPRPRTVFTWIFFRDECVNFALQKGFDASRSKIKYFRHNDHQHLEQLLEQQEAEDRKVWITSSSWSFQRLYDLLKSWKHAIIHTIHDWWQSLHF